MARKGSAKNEAQDAEILKNKEYILKNAQKNNEQDKAIKTESCINDAQEDKIEQVVDKNKDQDVDISMIRIEVDKLKKSVKLLKVAYIVTTVALVGALIFVAL